jgi:hypothetical protein
MPRADNASRQRCAIYTRKSSEEGLEQEFNSLAAQCEACEAFIRSQRNEGWVLVRTRYDDGGFSGGNLERPALQHLITDIRAPNSRSARCGSNGALSTNPRHPRISAASCCCVPSHTACRKSPLAGSARSASASSATLQSSSTKPERSGGVLVSN